MSLLVLYYIYIEIRNNSETTQLVCMVAGTSTTCEKNAISPEHVKACDKQVSISYKTQTKVDSEVQQITQEKRQRRRQLRGRA